MTKRKYIRIALTPDDVDLFSEAKGQWEKKTGVSVSDSMFALGIIRHRIEMDHFTEQLDRIDFGGPPDDPF